MFGGVFYLKPQSNTSGRIDGSEQIVMSDAHRPPTECLRSPVATGRLSRG